MTLFFLIVLAAAWVAVFLPSVRRAKEASPYPSTRAFKSAMKVVSPRGASVTTLVVNPATARAHATKLAFARRQRRRRIAFTSLLGVSAFTGLAALTAGGGWVELHLAIDGCLFAFIAWLIESRNRRAERFHKVHRLRPAVRPAFDLSLDEEVHTGT